MCLFGVYRYVVAMLGNYDESEAFEVDIDGVRPIPEREAPVDTSTVKEGAAFDCWYAQDEQFYKVTVDKVLDNTTVLVTFEGFEGQDEVPFQYLAAPEEGEEEVQEGEELAEDADPQDLEDGTDADGLDDDDPNEQAEEGEEYPEEDLGHCVVFSLTLSDLSIDDFDEEAEGAFIDDIANGIGVEPNQVQMVGGIRPFKI